MSAVLPAAALAAAETEQVAAAGGESALNLALYVALPYIALAIFVVGHYWRYRYDKFGWTTRSSQLYESRMLRLGSPLFHFGILLVAGGHVGGLLVPKSVTEAMGVSETMYHATAIGLGLTAGFCTLVGAAILVYRRRTVGPVFSATTKNDKIMYVLLVGTIVAGLTATVLSNASGHGHDYRETVSPWFRSIFTFQPDTSLILAAPIGYRIHALMAFVLFAFWPFSRLVHVFSAPLGYFTRPYIVYRSRDERLGNRAPKRGWERVGS